MGTEVEVRHLPPLWAGKELSTEDDPCCSMSQEHTVCDEVGEDCDGSYRVPCITVREFDLM